MNNITIIIICILLGYLIGCINPSYIISRIKGFDIRTKGSGNAGASNAMMLLGKTVGVFCALFDILKAYISVRISTRMFPLFKLAGIITGSSCILGHMFPITMEFKGGKGLACLAGVCISYDVRLFLLLFIIEVMIAFITSYICFIAPSGSSIFSIILLLHEGILSAIIFMPVVVSVWRKHIINFKRIKYGVEAKLEYLWKKESEQNRIKTNWNQLTLEEKTKLNMLELN